MKRLYFLLIIFWATVAGSQSYEFAGSQPFNIQMVNLMDTGKLALKYDFFDVDGDGDLDLNLMGMDDPDTTSAIQIFNLRYFLEYQENIGTLNVPLFNARVNRFPSFTFPKGKGFMFPASADLNGDGFIDFVVSSEVDLYDAQYLQFQMSDGNGGFIKTNCLDWGLDPFPAFSLLIPELTDLDQDGDYDILLGGYRRTYDDDNEPLEVPVYFYAKNTGTSKNPEFLGWFENPYGLVPITGAMFTCGDIDHDGDMDMFSFDINENDATVIHFVENIAVAGQKPKFAPPVISPFGLPVAGEEILFIFPELVDIDTDGDLDLFFMYLADESVELKYYRNNMCVPDDEVLQVKLCKGEVYQYNNQTYSEAGDYYIQKDNPDGCITVVHLIITIIPDLQINVQLNGITLFTPDIPGFTYRWFDCSSGLFINGAVQYNFTPLYSGSFAVEITDLQGCKHWSACTSVVVTDTDEILALQLHVSPNPTNGIAQIQPPFSKPVTNIKIYNINGICLYNGSIKDNRIDFTDYQNGLYFVRFDFGENVVVKKVMVQK